MPPSPRRAPGSTGHLCRSRRPRCEAQAGAGASGGAHDRRGSPGRSRGLASCGRVAWPNSPPRASDVLVPHAQARHPRTAHTPRAERCALRLRALTHSLVAQLSSARVGRACATRAVLSLAFHFLYFVHPPVPPVLTHTLVCVRTYVLSRPSSAFSILRVSKSLHAHGGLKGGLIRRRFFQRYALDSLSP